MERQGWGRESDETNGGSNTAAQNSQSNPTKQITLNFLDGSYACCPFASHSRQLRSKGAGVLLRENIALDVSSHDTHTSGISLFLHFGRFTDVGVYKVRFDSSIERARPSLRLKQARNERIKIHSLSCRWYDDTSLMHNQSPRNISSV